MIKIRFLFAVVLAAVASAAPRPPTMDVYTDSFYLGAHCSILTQLGGCVQVNPDCFDHVSSVRFQRGLTCELYEGVTCFGRYIATSESVPSMANYGFDNWTRSVRCMMK